MVFLRGIVIWLVLMMAESLHGTARTLWLAPYIGDLRARQISLFTGSLLILIIATLLIRWLKASRVSQLLGVGVMWMLLTIGFEIALGQLILGYSWERIFSDYNLLKGGLMPLGLVILTLSPLIAAKVRGILMNRHQTV
jgi:hypothetical protein